MKKLEKFTSTLLVISMFLSNIVYAEELIETESLSEGVTSAISYGIDKAKNTMSNIFSLNSASGESNIEKDDESKFEDPGMEIELKDIQAFYDMGYELDDIDKAIELSPIYDKTPYELLQLKGQKKYIPHEIEKQSNDESMQLAAVDDDTELIDDTEVTQEIQDYEFTVEETSWESVQMDLNLEYQSTEINENQWELIKLSGVDKLIDESMLSEEEKAALADADINPVSDEISTYAASSTSVSTVDMYNNYIFPKSMHEQVNQGGYTISDDISINELTGNNIVKSTDISLPGRNGLDLNLTRYYSVANANNMDATILKKNSSSGSTRSNRYYSVCGNPKVTIYYKEPLADGSKEKSFLINGVYIAPGRVNYNVHSEINSQPKITKGMFVSQEAYDEDLERLKAGREPQYMFTDKNAAQQCITYAEKGDYNYTIAFKVGGTSKISKIVYDASQAKTFDVYDVGTYTVVTDTSEYYNDVEDSSFSKYFNIGTGWAFDFPYIEKRYDNNEKEIYEYLHMGLGGVWQIEDNNLVDYYLKDIQISGGTGSFNGEVIDYLLTEKDGKKYYFGNIGQLLGIEDRYGNKILFSYDKIQDGRFYYPRLKQITDSVGRVVTISNTNNKVVITVTDKNDSSQNRVVEYNITGAFTNDRVLSSVKNAEGYVTTYEYKDRRCSVSMLSKNIDDSPSQIDYKELTTIAYPTDKRVYLEYSTMKKNCGLGGVMEIPVLNVKHEYYSENNTTSTRKSKESYRRDTGANNSSAVYDGYPTFRSIKEVPDEYRVYSYNKKEPFRQIMERTQHSIYKRSYNGNRVKESVFDEYDDAPSETEPGHIYKVFTDYEYDKQELLTKEISRLYLDYDNRNTDSNTYVQTTKEYTYDTEKYGDILSEKINGNSNYTTNYVYDSTYHIPTKITKKKDNSATLVTNYTLTTDKKSISSVTVTENNSTKKKRAYTYDGYGNVISEKRYTGSNNWNDYIEIIYNYDDARSVTNKLNGAYLNKISVSGVRDADGKLISGTSAGTVTQSYTYDWYGNTISETDAKGQTYQYKYDKLNRVTKVTNPDASTIEYTFAVDKNTNDVTVKDANNNVIKYSYDHFGYEKSSTDVTNNVLLSESRRYSDNNFEVFENIRYSTQNGGTKTQLWYNSLGEVVRKMILDIDDNILYHEDIWIENAVDGMLQKTTAIVYGDTDAENVKNIQYTDIYGNVVKEETVYNENDTEKSAVTEYTYDYLGNVKTVREPRAAAEGWASNQYTAKYDYDVDGNVTKETDINGNSIVNTYDGLGRLTSVTDKNGNTTTNTYDSLGRLLQEQIPFQKNGTSTVYATNKYYYDANGNVTKSQTANNAVGSNASYTTTEYTYNWQNQPTKVRGFNGSDVESCVQYYYDSVGNVLRMYTGDVNGMTVSGLDKVSGSSNYAVTKYTYDSMNRCTSQIDALGQAVNNTYDINGNLIKTVDRNGNTLNYTYDGLNQLTQKSSGKTADDTYTYAYNKKGNRISMTGGGVNTTFVYNNLGQLAKETLTDGTVKEYTYDMNGNRKSFKLTKNGTVQYTLTYDYDKLNQLTKVYEDGTVKAEYTYNPDGTLKKSSYGSQSTDYTYNLAKLLTEVNNANGSTQISKYSYTYYVDGNQKSKTESVAGTNKGTTNYTYDGLNRLVQEEAPNNTYSYQYDKYGNRKQLSVTGDENYITSYTYDKNNRMRKQTKTVGTSSEITDFWYDPNGNQISSMTISTGGTGTAGIGIELAGGNTNSINEYNSWNQLTKTMQNGKTASYTYNGDGLRMSKTVDGVTTSHIWDGTNIAGDITNGTVTKYIRGLQLISSKNDNNESFYSYNGHGDVVQLTSGTGAITKQYSYDAFGVEQNKDDKDTNPFRYCGEYYDTETDSVYLRARYYRPTTGRFITEDSIRDGLNWYVYCYSNSVNYFDNTGLAAMPLRRLMMVLGGGLYWDRTSKQAFVSINNGGNVPFYQDDGDGTCIDWRGIMYTDSNSVYYWLGLNLTNREKAVVYARVYGSDYVHNPDYWYNKNANCTNFVSQCLYEGGFKMDSEWWYNFETNDSSRAWGLADNLYRYLTDTLGFNNVSYIPNGSDIFRVADSVNPGDVIAWNNFDEVKKGKINHLAIVSYVENGNIYYCGNTYGRYDELLRNDNLNGDLYIVHLNYPQ